jgi:hypothetical protein
VRWRWPWPRRHQNGTAALRAVAEAKQREQESKLRQAERETPRYERLAEAVANLPPEDLVDRVARMLRVGHS